MSYSSVLNTSCLSLLVAVVTVSAVTCPTALAGLDSKRVLVIGMDGAGGRYVQATETPNLDALAAAGAARYDFYNEGGLVPNAPGPYGASGVNWSTILTGASAAHHGVSDNSFAGSRFDQYPHFFQHAKLANPTLNTVSLANWTPINTFITPDAYTNLEIGYDAGSLAQQDVLVKNDAVQTLQTGDPDALFLHFDQVDGAGHSFSWGSVQHLAAIRAVDSLIGEVIAALYSRPGVVSGAEDWLVLVTADHGASPGAFGHDATQGPANWEVPFIASGPSVVDGAPLQRGTLRDIAATALWHLGVDPFLAGLDGTIRGLTVAPPSGVVGDFNGDGLFAGNGTGTSSTDDVRAFLDNWRVTGAGGVADRYGRGDINLDGVTDLSDWALVNRLDPAIGLAIAQGLNAIPEPSSLALIGSITLLTCNRRVCFR